MKRRLLSLLAFTLGLVSSAWALEKDGDVYQIGTAQDLADFSALVNGGEFTANAVLTSDIDMSELAGWTAIGDWGLVSGTSSACYKGHFDGQGHSITGFKFTATHNYYGIFGVISSCLIENFSVYGEISTNVATIGGVAGYARDATPTVRNVHSYVNINNTANGKRLGGILGTSHNGTVVVDRCTYSGILDGNDSGGSGNYGGIVGYVNNNANAKLQVTNCLFDGKLINTNETPGGCTFGGIIGYVGANITDLAIKNCLSIGNIQSAVTGQFYGAVKSNKCSIVNSYYQGDSVNGSASTVTPTTQETAEVTTEQLASGEICFLLNENVSGGTNWFQTIDIDAYPMPYGSDKVYANGSFYCDMTPKEGVEVAYSNTNESVVDPHAFADGFCSVCGAFDETYMTANDEGIFEIGTGAQLKWFATYVNTKDVAANAILTDDIDLTGIAWTPIGTGSGNVAPGETAYTGIFDGQGYGITGFSAEGAGHIGLFGDANGATIKNFSISGNINVTAGYCAGVVANLTKSTIENVHSALVINVPNTDTHHVGGVVGSARSNNTISGCSFSGSLSVASSTDNFAGIAAYITNYDNVINCANYGNVTFSASACAAGGVVGYVNAQEAYIQNCLSIGIILFAGEGTPTYGAAIIGRTKGFAADKVTNNYWLEGSAYGTIHNNDGSEANVTGSVTAEQLASGEVAYKLGEAWGQLLESDPYPTPSYDVKVSYVGEAGYATLYDTTTGYTLNGDAKAYVAVLYKTWLELTMIDNVPAGTPVILKGTYYNKVAADLNPINIANELKGTDVDTEADGSQYVLAQPEGEPVGFYPATTDIIPAGKAYYQSTSGVKAFFFEGEDATGIEDLNTQNTQNTQIFNIAGQRISKLQKGINIVGGKKILK